MYHDAGQIKQLVDAATTIVIVQADNPDGDSLGSSLALEQILGDMGKEVVMVCGISLPRYLSYFPGWDRVERDLPNHFDLAIIVDASSITLMEQLLKPPTKLRQVPLIVLDHHNSEGDIDFARVKLIDQAAAATAEVIYGLAKQLEWPLPPPAKDATAAAILSDTLGLTSDKTSARTMYTMAELVEGGVSLSALENARRDFQRKSPELVRYKGQLLERIEYFDNNRIALLSIPWPEIEQYSPLYNPSMLAIEDMRLTTGTEVAVVLKFYPDGKITAKIRSNYGQPIAAKLAEAFGGGGHDYASGFKLLNSPDPAKLKNEIVAKARELIDASL